MPSIEISTDQAAALARGESITLDPEPRIQHFITVRPDGTIFEWSIENEDVQPWSVVRAGSNCVTRVGRTSVLPHDFRQNVGDTTIEVSK